MDELRGQRLISDYKMRKPGLWSICFTVPYAKDNGVRGLKKGNRSNRGKQFRGNSLINVRIDNSRVNDENITQN
jgi:hypothetical protein